MSKNTVYVVVSEGLVQEVYASNSDTEIVICDLDTEDTDTKDELDKFIVQLPDFAKKVY